jgi:hypothetical protein
VEALTAREARFLARLPRAQRTAAAVGVLLTLAGALYAAWGIWVFDYRIDPRTQPDFDGPVASLAHLYDGYERLIGQIRAETPTETLLLDSMRRGIYFSAGTLVLVMRLFLGTLVALGGLVALTVVVERRRLLAVIRKLRPD